LEENAAGATVDAVVASPRDSVGTKADAPAGANAAFGVRRRITGFSTRVPLRHPARMTNQNARALRRVYSNILKNVGMKKPGGLVGRGDDRIMEEERAGGSR
jgi:hypothetical protein